MVHYLPFFLLTVRDALGPEMMGTCKDPEDFNYVKDGFGVHHRGWFGEVAMRGCRFFDAS